MYRELVQIDRPQSCKGHHHENITGHHYVGTALVRVITMGTELVKVIAMWEQNLLGSLLCGNRTCKCHHFVTRELERGFTVWQHSL